MTAGPPLRGPLTMRSLLDTAGPAAEPSRVCSAMRQCGPGRQSSCNRLVISGERNPPD
jgi:hypothetical protein